MITSSSYDPKPQFIAGFAIFFVLAAVVSVPGYAQPGRLDAPDPAQMEDAPQLPYQAVSNGLKIPATIEMGAPSGVVWTEDDHLLVLNRGDHPLLEFDSQGNFLRSLTSEEYTRPHGLRLDADGNVWTADDRGHNVKKLSRSGEVLLQIGTFNQPGDPEDGLLNEPTDVAFNDQGEIFVIVGHGTGVPYVVKFDADGNFIKKWGGQGTAPGKFNTPHSIVINEEGLIYVADRENRRVQIFDDDGNYIKEWHYKGLPCGLYFTADYELYMVSGFAGEVLQLDKNGKAIGAFGQPGPGFGEFGEAHYMTLTPDGDIIYVADTIKRELHKFLRQ